MQYAVPKGYPPSLDTEMLTPFKLSYDTLKEAVRTAHDGIIDEEMTIAQAKVRLFLSCVLLCYRDSLRFPPSLQVYLSTQCLNKATSDKIAQNAENARVFKVLEGAQDDGEDEKRAYEAVKQLKDANPHAYDMWKFPGLWCRGFPLELHIDAIMHLLFEGIVNAVAMMIFAWLQLQNKAASFKRTVEGQLEGIQRLNLVWCKVQP